MFHKGERSIVNGKAEGRHVVGVQNAMAETNCLPLGHQLDCSICDLLKHQVILIFCLNLVNFGVKVLHQVVKHVTHHLLL
jgi:hypothetical protein